MRLNAAYDGRVRYAMHKERLSLLCRGCKERRFPAPKAFGAAQAAAPWVIGTLTLSHKTKQPPRGFARRLNFVSKSR